MTTWLVDNVLRSEGGLNDDDIALINKELPDLENLIAVIESHIAQLNRALPLLAVAKKIIQTQRNKT